MEIKRKNKVEEKQIKDLSPNTTYLVMLDDEYKEPMSKEEADASVEYMGNFVNFMNETCPCCNTKRLDCRLETCKELQKAGGL